jgi:hypothetical protein
MFGKQAYEFNGGPPVIIVNDAGKLTGLDWSKVRDAFSFVVHDKAKYEEGSVVAGQQYELFAVPIGGNAITANGTTQYNKKKDDTSMQQARQFPQSEGFILQQINVIVRLATARATTYGTGQNITVATDPTATATNSSAANLIDEIISTFTIDLKIQNKFYEGGLIEDFGARQGLSGAVAADVGSAATSAFGGFIQNGFGRSYRCAIPHDIKGQRTFAFVIEPQRSLTIPVPFDIRVSCDGIYYRGVQ